MPHAPKRANVLAPHERELAISNVLRYFANELHATLAAEFAEELDQHGHIYCYRFRPTGYAMKAHQIGEYPAECRQAACIMLVRGTACSAADPWPCSLASCTRVT